MIGYVISAIFLSVGLVEYSRYKTLVAPSVFFSGYWAAISFAASLQLYDQYTGSAKTWFIILLGTLSFVLGTKIKLKKHHSKTFLQKKITKKRISPKKVYWIVFMIVGTYVTDRLIHTVHLLNTNVTAWEIRAAALGEKLAGYVYIQSNTVSIVMDALLTLLIAAGIEFFLVDIKKNWIYIVLSAYLCIGNAVVTVGRWGLLFFVVEFFVCRSLLIRKDIIKKAIVSSRKKRKTIVICVLFAAVIILVFWQISSSRGTTNMMRELYVYFSGCVPLLDLKAKRIDQIGIYSFIFAGQNGFWTFVGEFLERVFGANIPLLSATSKYVMTGQDSVFIGSGTYNAFTTCFYYLYADLRFLGVALGMFVFGMIAGGLYRQAISNNDIGSVFPYLIVAQVITNSLHTYVFTSATNFIMFFMLLLIFLLKKYRLHFG